jgi:hypothetical protein
LKAKAAAEIAAGEPGYYARSIERQKARETVRRCGYCNETKHNRRGCKALKAEVAITTNVMVGMRKAFVAALATMNLVEGSFVSFRSYNNWEVPKDPATAGEFRVGIVKKILWQRVTPWNHEERGAIFNVNVHMKNHRGTPIIPTEMWESVMELGAKAIKAEPKNLTANGYNKTFGLQRIGSTVYILDEVPEGFTDHDAVQKTVKEWYKSQTVTSSLGHGARKSSDNFITFDTVK